MSCEPAEWSSGKILATDYSRASRLGVAPVRIDVMSSLKGCPDFEGVWKNLVDGAFGTQPACYLGLKDLIRAKLAADRLQDRADVRVLRRAQAARRKRSSKRKKKGKASEAYMLQVSCNQTALPLILVFHHQIGSIKAESTGEPYQNLSSVYQQELTCTFGACSLLRSFLQPLPEFFTVSGANLFRPRRLEQLASTLKLRKCLG